MPATFVDCPVWNATGMHCRQFAHCEEDPADAGRHGCALNDGPASQLASGRMAVRSQRRSAHGGSEAQQCLDG
jgi:hypothetical protein